MKLKLSIKEQKESYENAKIYYIENKFENKYMKDKKYRKVRDHCHYTGEYRSAPDSATPTVPVEEKLQELIKMEKKLQKIYLTYYNLLIVQDLWQGHNQILSIISLKEFIELNVNLETMMKNVKHIELNISIASIFLNIQILKII